MKSKIFVFLTVFVLCFNFLFSGLCSAENDEFVIGVDVNVPPMGFLGENGDVVGLDIDLAREVCKVMGKKLKVQPIDWDAKELELNTNKIDAIWNGMSYTPERDQNMLLTSAYMQNRQVLVVKKDANISNLDDLKQKNICGQKGSTGITSLKNSAVGKNAKIITELDNMVDCLNEVRLGKSEATVVDEVVVRYYFTKNSLQNDFKILDQELETEDYVIAVRKDNLELKDKIEKALKVVVEDGRAGEISRKWVGSNVITFSAIKEKESAMDNKNVNVFSELFQGLLVTLKLFAICWVMSIPLGLILCFLRRVRLKFVKIIIDVYIWIMRGTPLLLQIFFLFYGLPLMFPNLQMNDRFLVGVIAFVLNYVAYFAEIFRGGIKNVDKGQFESIKVLKIPKIKAMFRIIIPQMLRVCLPSICNESVALVKDTALIFSVGVIELLTTAKNLVNTNADILAYIIAAGIYLLICSLVNLIFKIWENKLKFE